MRFPASRCFKALSSLAVFAISAFSGTAFAQQITYYDFDTPQANPSQVSRSCSTTAPAGALFCLNDATGQNANPSFLSDTYPAIVDPVTTDNPPQISTHYATQMTPPQADQGSSLWFSVPQKISNGFTTYFAFKFTQYPGSYATADGLAFVIQNSSGGGTVPYCTSTGAGLSIVGGEGGCIGYGGIDNSLAIEFDTYRNPWDSDDYGNGGYDDNHIAVQNCGSGLPNSPDHTGSCLVNLNVSGESIPALIDPPGVTLADGNVHQIVVQYSGPNEATPYLLQIFIDPVFVAGTHTPVAGSVPVISGIYNIGANLNLINSGTANDSAYVGFTSATGNAVEQHEILAWTYTPHTAVTQQQPVSQPGQPTVFPFGNHVYAVTYPADAPPPPANTDMIITATAVSPALFSQLVSGGPFSGSQCQVYDGTGGNCIVYSATCVNTASNTIVQCPATNSNDPIIIKTAFDNSVQPVSPGFIQGDPFYSAVASVSGNGQTATVTCAGDCSVAQNQTITLLGNSNTAFDGTITVTSASASTPNTFTFASTVSGQGTGGYLTSNNQQNIFFSYTTQRIDGSISGKTLNFGSDFSATSVTNIPTILKISAPNVVYGTTATVTVTATSANGVPTGSMQLSVNGGTPITSSLSSIGVATFTLTGLAPATYQLAVSYTQTGVFQAGTANGTLTVNAAPAATFTPSSVNFGNFYPNGPGEYSWDVTTQTVTVSNSGTALMTVGTPSLSGAGKFGAQNFTLQNSCSSTLAVGKSCTMQVTFIPGSSVNQYTATLNVPNSGPSSSQSVGIVATVVEPLVTMSASTGTISFGTQNVGTTTPIPVKVTNTGYNALVFTSITLGGNNSSQFSETNNCPTTLVAGASCTITASFSPTQSGGPYSAVISLVDNAQSKVQQITLSGTGQSNP